MDLLPMNKLGARELEGRKLSFGVLLPWVAPQGGFRVFLKVLHEHDQFLQAFPPARLEMAHSVDSTYGDFWSVDVDLNLTPSSMAGSHWGRPGTYVYRYLVERPGGAEVDWVIDPCAREFGTGKLSAITAGYQPHVWGPGEQSWKVPDIRDLIMYELMIDEFAGDVDGAIGRLDYLADLGVNCLEIMPVSNVALEVDWGFLPIGYFGVDERLGNRRDLQRLVEGAHERGMAVILDVVYGHTSDCFAYSYLYRRLEFDENPFMGAFAKNYFGESTDFGRKLTRDFFVTVNHHLLNDCHVDGFRYDCVPNFWDGPMGQGYSKLLFDTYRMVKDRGATRHWQRFFDGGRINLIQCAEQLEDPAGVLQSTYSNSTWQNETYSSAKAVAHGSAAALTDLGFRSGLSGYPQTSSSNGDTVTKAALQYFENHDHERFLCNFGLRVPDPSMNYLFQEGERTEWPRVQPYLICLFTAVGVPMIWQGQEFAENYFLPDHGLGRVALLRPVRWDYFYDEAGKAIVGLLRKLAKMRNRVEQLRRGDHFFYNDWNRYQSNRLLLYSRSDASAFTLVALNFSQEDRTVPFKFERAGTYRDELHGQLIGPLGAGQQVEITVPSNYGRVWTLQ
ncbi:MAG: alpha-amylase family glycosyl hydrolase [Actinomycetota bacterium]